MIENDVNSRSGYACMLWEFLRIARMKVACIYVTNDKNFTSEGDELDLNVWHFVLKPRLKLVNLVLQWFNELFNPQGEQM